MAPSSLLVACAANSPQAIELPSLPMGSGHLELDLLDRAVKGDRASLSQLLLLHYDGLRRHIAMRLRGELARLVIADDILHQTMVRASQAIGRYQPRHEGAFRAWLQTISDNLIKDAQKRRRRERRVGQEKIPGENGSWAAVVERIAGDGTTASVRGQRRENADRLLAALASLPDDQRDMVERYYLKEQSLDEIAESLGCSKGAVRASCYRARKQLRELMGRSSLYFSG